MVYLCALVYYRASHGLPEYPHKPYHSYHTRFYNVFQYISCSHRRKLVHVPNQYHHVLFETALRRLYIKIMSIIEVSSMISTSHSKGLSSFFYIRPEDCIPATVYGLCLHTGSFRHTLCRSSGWCGKEDCGTQFLKYLYYRKSVVVLPVPGPPVRTMNFDTTAFLMASICTSSY